MKRVLFVDDEMHVLKVIERKFETSNIKCYFTTLVSEAIDILKDKEIDVLVTDIEMPNINGIKFSKIVQEVSPRTVRIILSGSSRVQSIVEAINEAHVYKYIEKPWHVNDDAIELIEEAIKVSKRYEHKKAQTFYIPIEELNKFQEYQHWVLVDFLDHIVYKNSDYPVTEIRKDKAFKVVYTSSGEMKLYNAE